MYHSHLFLFSDFEVPILTILKALPQKNIVSLDIIRSVILR